MKLIEDNRIKNRKLGAGAKRLLDSDDEIFIAKVIQEKCTAHGRRTDTTLYADHRVKKKDFKNLANYILSLRGKKLSKSSTTVMNRGNHLTLGHTLQSTYWKCIILHKNTSQNW